MPPLGLTPVELTELRLNGQTPADVVFPSAPEHSIIIREDGAWVHRVLTAGENVEIDFGGETITIAADAVGSTEPGTNLGIVNLADYDPDPTDNNATGDQTSTAFEEALAAAGALSATPFVQVTKGIVFVPPGVYRVERPILIPPSVRLVGAGWQSSVILPTGTFEPSADLITFLVRNELTDGTQEYVGIQDIGFNGGAAYGIELDATILLDTIGGMDALARVLVVNSFKVGIRLRCTTSMSVGSCGGASFEDVWVNVAGEHCVLVEAPYVMSRWRNLKTERMGETPSAVQTDTGYAGIYFSNPGAPDGDANGNHLVHGFYTETTFPDDVYGVWLENQTATKIEVTRGSPHRVTGDGAGQFGSTGFKFEQVQTFPTDVAIYDETNSVEVPGPIVTEYPAASGAEPHAETHEPGGSDAMTVDADAATGSLRTLGTGATQAAAGDHLHDSRYYTETEVDTALGGKVPTSRQVNGHALSSDVTVTKGDVGLGSVDNTADTAKPVSTAQQTALDLKANTASAVMDGDAAGGVLGGTYPNPSFASDMATQAELDTHKSSSDHDGRYYTEAEVDALVAARIANSLVDAKGDLLTATADNTPARLAAGANGKILSAASGETTGLKWIDAPVGGGGLDFGMAKVVSFADVTVPEDDQTEVIALDSAGSSHYAAGEIILHAYRAGDGANTFFGKWLFRKDFYRADDSAGIDLEELAKFDFLTVLGTDIFLVADGTDEISVQMLTPITMGDTLWRGHVLYYDEEAV